MASRHVNCRVGSRMRHIWTVLCQNCIVDSTSNNPSLIEIPDRVGFKGDLPDERPLELSLPTPFYLVSKWWKDNSADAVIHNALGRIFSPKGKQLTQFDIPFEFGKSAGHRTIGTVEKLLYSEDGVYEFQICTRESEAENWIPVASIPLEIVHEQPESEQQESEPTE